MPMSVAAAIAIALVGVLAAPCGGQEAAAAAPPAAAPGLIPEWWSRQVVCTTPRATPAAPVIDGNITYREWYHASSVGGFIEVATGNVSTQDVRLYTCWDDTHVYLAMKVDRPPMHPTPRATFLPGRHDHLWWKDDNVELVIQPGRRERGNAHFYALAVNSVGAWSVMRGALDGAGGDTAWPCSWRVAATRQGLEHWAAEVAIPIADLEGCERPGPGAVWFMDAMNQQVTPAKRMVDLGLIWNLNRHGYRSTVLPAFVFVEHGPVARPHGIGRLPVSAAQKAAGEATVGSRMVFYNTGTTPIALTAQMQLFKAAAERPPGALDLFTAWDIIQHIRETGKPWLDPKQEVQAFRSEADILRELNERYQFVKEHHGEVVVPPRGDTAGAAYSPLEEPLSSGEYIVAWRYADAATGEVLSAQVVPFAVLPGLRVTLRPYFLTHGRLRAEASLENLVVSATDHVAFELRVGDAVLDAGEAPVVPGAEAVHVYLDCREVRPGSTATVTARLLRSDGAEALRNSAVVTRPPTPSWFGNRIGRSAVVPPPFEPVRPDGDLSARVWERRLTIGAAGLPSSVVARGSELLARPIALDAGDAAVAMPPVRVATTDRDAEFAAVGRIGAAAARMRTVLHYDGTARFDLTLDPGAAEVVLPRLILEIPMQDTWAVLATHHATRTDPQRARSTGFAGSVDEWLAAYPDGAIPFSYAVFVGTEDRGLQWFCESDRGWANADEERVIRIVREPGATVLRIAVADAPLALTAPWTLTFGLTVTPVKDTRANRAVFRAAEGRPYDEDGLGSPDFRKAAHDAYAARGINAVSIYMTDDNHFGCPRMYNPAQEAKVRAYVDLVHRRGFRITPYTGWGVNANIPDFATFGQEMLAEPVRNIGWGCFLHVHNQVLQDWWLDGARYTIEECGLDGVYGDAFSMPRLLQNELEGYAWTDRAGRPRGTYGIWAIREFIERLYVFCHVESSRPAIVRNHTNEEVYAIGGFTDERVTGEGQYHAGDTLLGVHSPSACRANFMTHLNGVHTVGLWWNYHKLPVTRNEMHAMFLLHDVPMAVGGGIVQYYGNQIGYGRFARPWVHLRQVRAAFDGARFTGYWQDPGVRCEPPGPLASTWVGPQAGQALVVVSNLPKVPWSGTVILDRGRLGVAPDAEARDAMVDEPIPAEAGGLPLEIQPQRYRLILVGARVPIPEKARRTDDDAAP